MADVLEQLNVLLSLDASEFDKGVDRVANRADKDGNRIGGALSRGMDVAKAGIVTGAGVAVGAIAGIGAAAITAQGQVQTLEKAFGAPLEDAADEALFLASAYDQDLTEAARSAQRVQDEFGGSAEDAFLVLTEGQELGLDRFGDLNDTLNEYSDDFANLGVTGFDSLALINAGLEAGFMNTDKVGDAFNEFGIRLRDPAVVNAMGDIDETTADLFDQFARGEITEREAFEGIANSIESIEDPLKRQEAGVLAFGTTFEDFGEDATFALGDALEGVESLGTQIQESGREYNSFGALWAGVTSEAQAALVPLGDKLLEVGQVIMPVITQAIQWLGQNAPGWIDAVSRAFRTVGTVIQPVITAVKSIIGAFGEGGTATDTFGNTLTTFGETWEKLKSTVTTVVNGIKGVVESVFGVIATFISNNQEEIRSTFEMVWNKITAIIDLALQLIDATITPALNAISTFISNNQDTIVGLIETAWSSIETIISLALDAISTALNVVILLLNGDFTGAWQAIRDFIANLMPALETLIVNAWNTVIGVIGLVASALGIDLQGAFDTIAAGWGVFYNTFIQPLIDGFQKVIDVVGGAIEKIKELQNLPGTVLEEVSQGFRLVTRQLDEDEVVTGFASGGVGSGWSVVGEQGPELVNLGRASAVLPAGVTAGVLGGGGQTVTLNMSVGSVDSAERAQQTARMALSMVLDALEGGQNDVLLQGVV